MIDFSAVPDAGIGARSVSLAMTRRPVWKPADDVAMAASGAAAATAAGPSVTSADFLTLLVSELKNQDPTQPTDPNAYVQQLVGVNSLQQLIQINQGLTGIEKSRPASTVADQSLSV